MLLACLAILIFLAFRFFALIREGRNNPQLPADQTNVPQKPSVNIQNTRTQAVSPENLKLPIILYRDHHFDPVTVTLEQNTPGTGCVIQVKNESMSPLTIRLSPHEKALKGNWGGQYDPVPPGKSVIIDPRFDMEYASFHNHSEPGEEFHVRIGNSCRSDL